jgi:hypothetical protein
MSTYSQIRTTAAVRFATLGLLGGGLVTPALAAHHHGNHMNHRRRQGHIPQHNRSDKDRDNNGGRNDGDGNV